MARKGVNFNITKRGSRWFARVYFGSMVGDDGKRHRRYISRTFDTQGEARSWIEDTRSDARRDGVPERHDYTVGKWLTEWLESEVEPNRSPQTTEGYRQTIENHIVPAIGRTRLDRITSRGLAVYRDEKLKTLSGTTVYQHLNILRAALTVARQQNLIRRNVAEDVTRPRVARPVFNTLPPEQVVPFIEAAHRDSPRQMHGPVVLALLAGLRAGEALGLKWSDVDLDSGLLTVRRAAIETEDGLALKDAPKTRASRRIVALPPLAVAELRAWQQVMFDVRQRAGSRWKENDLVCPRRKDGTVRRISNLGGDLKALLAKHPEFPQLRFHDLRHSYATLLQGSGMDISDVSKALGHSSIRVTSDLYVHGNAERIKRVRDALDRLLASSPPPEGFAEAS